MAIELENTFTVPFAVNLEAMISADNTAAAAVAVIRRLVGRKP
ncbi:MAG TPA: hypothetical protein VH021_24170 [Trebonia sp.]|jgi:hypothetical protein|nr:hypothetical protein [Trebonia sp.]